MLLLLIHTRAQEHRPRAGSYRGSRVVCRSAMGGASRAVRERVRGHARGSGECTGVHPALRAVHRPVTPPGIPTPAHPL
ncbi:hypothetical protein ATSB10_02750 [Dyella thiooxydans]|uniref:Uncharacterized protein n=1 Tax=Dyella thiooxydans TaxID=445710 RepID=A0A161J1I5_9GAMM|nr:hypothetical protein ATSB10_02750 [Dyella thiooxydans]